MKPFKPDRNSDRKRSFGSSRDFGSGRDDNRRDFRFDSGSDRAEMHKATCSSCGASCEVPFKPRLGKPIKCNNCFKKPEGFSTSTRFGSRPEPASRGVDKNESISRQLDAINAKLDKVLQRFDLLIDGEDD